MNNVPKVVTQRSSGTVVGTCHSVSSSSINAFKNRLIKSEGPGWATLWTSSD